MRKEVWGRIDALGLSRKGNWSGKKSVKGFKNYQEKKWWETNIYWVVTMCQKKPVAPGIPGGLSTIQVKPCLASEIWKTWA